MADERQKINLVSKKDLEFSYYCGPGHGGQAKNKVASGVMIRHLESGALGRAHDSRSQDQNKRTAFERLVKTPQMKFFLARKLYEINQQETMEETVARDMAEKNLKVEVKNEKGQWEEVQPSYFETERAKELVA